MQRCVVPTLGVTPHTPIVAGAGKYGFLNLKIVISVLSEVIASV